METEIRKNIIKSNIINNLFDSKIINNLVELLFKINENGDQQKQRSGIAIEVQSFMDDIAKYLNI